MRKPSKITIATLPALSLLGLLVIFFKASADNDQPPQALPTNPQVDDLAKRAFEIVEDQVREATTQGSGWSSQPGAIRTFNDDGSTARLYKLYSAPDLLAGSAAESLADLPADWDQSRHVSSI